MISPQRRRSWWYRFAKLFRLSDTSAFIDPSSLRRVSAYDPASAGRRAFRFAVLWYALPAAILVLTAYMQHHR